LADRKAPGAEKKWRQNRKAPGAEKKWRQNRKAPGSGDELPYEPESTGPGSGDEEPTGPGSGDEISQSEDFKNKAIASCNAIPKAGTCVEYIGSFWATIENSELNCKGAGTYSRNPCPRPVAGGCNISPGTNNEIVTWHYFYGGGGYNAENIPYVAAVCNATGVASWVFGG